MTGPSAGNEGPISRFATIIALPESKRDKRRVFAEWMDGSRDWVSRDDLREIWATSFAE